MQAFSDTIDASGKIKLRSPYLSLVIFMFEDVNAHTYGCRLES